MKKTQIIFIKGELLSKGEISRNHCLRNYISRLSARILDLEKQGWVFTTEKREGDFVYKAVVIPEIDKKVYEAKKKVRLSLYPMDWTQEQLALANEEWRNDQDK